MCPLTVDYSWGYTMPCKKHYSYTWTKGYGSDRLNAAGGYADGRLHEVYQTNKRKLNSL